MLEIEAYVQSIRRVYPDLPIVSARFNEEGQNNVVVFVNEEFIFRFPRYPVNLKEMKIELAILTGIQDYMTLRIPNPLFIHLEASAGSEAFMGYRLIPGEQLRRETISGIQDERVLERLADQLAGFLQELHRVPVRDAIAGELPRADTAEEWADIYARIQARCFLHMRPDARAWATRHFERYLSNQQHFSYQPVLKHGDFGISNILFDATSQTVSGIIDFGGATLGDPAYDFAGLLSSYGEAFLHRLERTYPELPSLWERVCFYQGTFALLEALFGVEQGDEAAFRNGIADYI